jgi:hypothetical protein
MRVHKFIVPSVLLLALSACGQGTPKAEKGERVPVPQVLLARPGRLDPLASSANAFASRNVTSIALMGGRWGPPMALSRSTLRVRHRMYRMDRAGSRLIPLRRESYHNRR